MKLRSIARTAGWGLAATAIAMSSLVAGTSSAGAQTNPYERGPAPTSSSLLASSGPFATTSTSVSGFSVTGFGGGRIYYPTTTTAGTFGGVALAPGFTATSSMYSGIAQRIASHGFVVFAIDTTTTFDQPASRGRQILAALDYLTQRSSVRTRVDASRLAAAGHSMGGGGTLQAANDRSSLQAAVALQPWNTDKTWGGIQVPTMIIGAQLDTIAAPSSHSLLFYNSIPASSEKAYAELAGASHTAANTNPAWQGREAVVWLKRYVDNDTRYEQFMCPRPVTTSLSDYRDTCPG
jgi:dienelactone hydrolase